MIKNELRKCECEITEINNHKTISRKNIIGYFHKWGIEYEEYENGIGNFTVGIVEFEDGSIETIIPRCIKFLD